MTTLTTVRRGSAVLLLAVTGALGLTGCAFEFELGGSDGESTTESARPAGTSGSSARATPEPTGDDRVPDATPDPEPTRTTQQSRTAPPTTSGADATGAGSGDRAGSGGSSGSSNETRVINGSWTGTATQAGQAPYTVDVTIQGRAGEQTATVEYPDLHCEGTWTITPAGEDSYRANEVITSGSRCLSPVTITLEQTGADTISYRVASPGVTATLRRV